MMNIGIPSIVVKMLRNKFDQQWSVRKSGCWGSMERKTGLRQPKLCRDQWPQASERHGGYGL
jgi:hypothetical protein